MNPLLKLSAKIEEWLIQINHTVPARAWYTILLLTILGVVFLSSYLGPQLSGYIIFLWLFSLAIVIFDEIKPAKDSYLGLIFAILLLLVFSVLVVSSILRYL